MGLNQPLDAFKAEFTRTAPTLIAASHSPRSTPTTAIVSNPMPSWPL
jgi:hypothetical protein